MAHDFKKWPELTNGQMGLYYWDSPHRQILEDFEGKVERVIDGDTFRIRWSERDFSFPVRFANIASPEKDEDGGRESMEWLKNRLEGKEVLVRIDKNNRVGKWGRIIGMIYESGINIGEESMFNGHSISWNELHAGGLE